MIVLRLGGLDSPFSASARGQEGEEGEEAEAKAAAEASEAAAAALERAAEEFDRAAEELEADEERARRERRRQARLSAKERRLKATMQALARGERVPLEVFETVESELAERDVVFSDGIPYRRKWTMEAGVTQLDIPAYDGWVQASPDSDLFANFASQSREGNRLASVLVNQRFVEATASPYVNWFVLVQVPQQYAFARFNARSFAVRKQAIRERAEEFRQAYVEREDFETFSDYINYKRGRDELVENYVDGYMLEASEGGDRLVYFYTSEFTRRGDPTQRDPLVGTTSYAVVRGKLLRIEVRKLMTSFDDIPQIVSFTEGFIEDLRRINEPGYEPQ